MRSSDTLEDRIEATRSTRSAHRMTASLLLGVLACIFLCGCFSLDFSGMGDFLDFSMFRESVLSDYASDFSPQISGDQELVLRRLSDGVEFRGLGMVALPYSARFHGWGDLSEQGYLVWVDQDRVLRQARGPRWRRLKVSNVRIDHQKEPNAAMATWCPPRLMDDRCAWVDNRGLHDTALGRSGKDIVRKYEPGGPWDLSLLGMIDARPGTLVGCHAAFDDKGSLIHWWGGRPGDGQITRWPEEFSAFAVPLGLATFEGGTAVLLAGPDPCPTGSTEAKKGYLPCHLLVRRDLTWDTIRCFQNYMSTNARPPGYGIQLIWLDASGTRLCWTEPVIPQDLSSSWKYDIFIWDSKTAEIQRLYEGDVRWLSFSGQHVAIEDLAGSKILSAQDGSVVREIAGARLPVVAGDYVAYLQKTGS